MLHCKTRMLLRECAFKGSAPGTRRRSCFIMHMLLYRLATHETSGGLNGYEYSLKPLISFELLHATVFRTGKATATTVLRLRK